MQLQSHYDNAVFFRVLPLTNSSRDKYSTYFFQPAVHVFFPLSTIRHIIMSNEVDFVLFQKGRIRRPRRWFMNVEMVVRGFAYGRRLSRGFAGPRGASKEYKLQNKPEWAGLSLGEGWKNPGSLRELRKALGETEEAGTWWETC